MWGIYILVLYDQYLQWNVNALEIQKAVYDPSTFSKAAQECQFFFPANTVVYMQQCKAAQHMPIHKWMYSHSPVYTKWSFAT
jgi:hypothetical protein